MQYPLPEKIGDPDLLVGREREFRQFHKWIDKMPKRHSKSWAILGRRKGGKTSFVQRLFNQLWSANGAVIPFYLSIPESPIWFVDLVIKYYETFASHYISFLERDPLLVRKPLTLKQIRAYGETHNNEVLVDDVNYMLEYLESRHYDLVWDRVYRAPHRMAAIYDQRILVIIDEFQYLSTFVYRREDLSGQPMEGMPGSFHEVSESKIAPMLATGSYVGWMIEIMGKYLEAGRLSIIEFSPYLTETEGLQAVYKYAEAFEEPITNETAVQINELCMADPFFISCVMQSNYPHRDLTESEGVIETVNHEIANRSSQLSGTWNEYINKTVDRINDQHGKQLLLHLNKYNDRYWTPQQLKTALQLDEAERSIQRKLLAMVKGDLIEWGTADIQFRGLQDGTLNLILRHRFEMEIAEYQPPSDLRPGFREQIAELQRANKTLRGKLANIVGIMGEYLFANTLRSRKRFKLTAFFTGVSDDISLNLTDVQTRVTIQRADGKAMALDIVAESTDQQVLLVEVRTRQAKSTLTDVEDFQEKVAAYQSQNPQQTVFAGFVSLGGFTQEAQQRCQTDNLAWTTELPYF